MQKVDLSQIKEDIFYKYIYPVYAKEFLFNSMYYEDFAKMIEKRFILNSIQWEYILEHWEFKESILTE